MFRPFCLVELSGAKRIINVETKRIASGGDGTIHRIVDEPTLVAKLYHDPGKDPTRLGKLKAMLADPPSLPVIASNQRNYVQIAWPTAWLEEHQTGRFIGFVMPAIDLSRATVLENLLARRARKAIGLPESYGYRLSTAANLAAVVAELHAHGHHIIDLKPVNLNIYTDSFYIAVLDCDGFSVRGDDGLRFPAHQFTDGYICPEALQGNLPPQDLGEAQDRFALAVILFQLLNQGIHPYQGVPVRGQAVPPTNHDRIKKELYAYGRAPHSAIAPSPWSIHQFLEDSTRVLFDRAFTSHHDRPSTQEWHKHLLPFASKKGGSLHICAKNSAHVHFSTGCPWCVLDRKQPLTSTSIQGVQQATRKQTSVLNRGAQQITRLQSSAIWQQFKKAVTRRPIPLWAKITAFIALLFPVYDVLTTSEDEVELGFSYDATRHTWAPEGYIRIVPEQTLSGKWEFVSLELRTPDGKVSGDTHIREDLIFIPDGMIAGKTYTAVARFNYMPMLFDYQVPVIRQWQFSAEFISKKFTKVQLGLKGWSEVVSSKAPDRLNSSVAFTSDGRFSFVTATPASKSERGGILVFERISEHDWQQVDFFPMKKKFHNFEGVLQVSNDDNLVASLVCNLYACNQLYFFQLNTEGRWAKEQVLMFTDDASQFGSGYARTFALSSNGAVVAVLTGSSLVFARRDDEGSWQVVQRLPYPDDLYRVSRGVFSADGHTFFVGGSIGNRASQQGVVLTYRVESNGLFSGTPEYIFSTSSCAGLAEELNISGNGEILAVSGRESTGRGCIQIYDMVKDGIRFSQTIKMPDEFASDEEAPSYFHRGLSLSYDGKRLLSGPSPRISHGSRVEETEWDAPVVLYQREEGKFRTARQLLLRTTHYPTEATLRMSPSGDYFIWGTEPNPMESNSQKDPIVLEFFPLH